MIENIKVYEAIVSSDWNECLAPSRPFDFISFNYPHLADPLESIFKQYTGNIITLGEAVLQIQRLLPAPINEKLIDHYLDKSFATYPGVSELIEWCRSRNILFMINTTAMIGYFQRIFAKNLLPEVQVLSAHPMVRYAKSDTDPPHIYDLLETTDKGKNTATVVRCLDIPTSKIIIMGDSGGDGPHFKWASENDAFLIANMTKPSLQRYCDQYNVSIDVQFGLSYKDGENKDLQKEMQVNFMDLAPVIENFVQR